MSDSGGSSSVTPPLTPTAPPRNGGDKIGPSPRMRYFTRPAETSTSTSSSTTTISKHGGASSSASAPIAGCSFTEEDSQRLVNGLLSEHSRPMALSEASSSNWGVSPLAGPERSTANAGKHTPGLGSLASQSSFHYGSFLAPQNSTSYGAGGLAPQNSTSFGGNGGGVGGLAPQSSLTWTTTPDGLVAQSSNKRIWRRQSNDCPMYLPELPVTAVDSVSALLAAGSGADQQYGAASSPKAVAMARMSGNVVLPEKPRLPPVDHPALATSPSYIADGGGSGDTLATEASSTVLGCNDGRIMESEGSAGRFPGFAFRRLSVETSSAEVAGRKAPAPLNSRSSQLSVDLSPTSPMSRATSIIDQWENSPAAGHTPQTERHSRNSDGGGSSLRDTLTKGEGVLVLSPAGQSRAAASLLQGFVAAAIPGGSNDSGVDVDGAQRSSRARHLFKAAVWTAKVMTSLNSIAIGIAAKRTGDEALDAASGGLSPESSNTVLHGNDAAKYGSIKASSEANNTQQNGGDSVRDADGSSIQDGGASAKEHPAVIEFSKAFSEVLDRRKPLATRPSFAIDRDAPRLSFALERGTSLARDSGPRVSLPQDRDDAPRLALPIDRDAPRLSFALDRAALLPAGSSNSAAPDMPQRISCAPDHQTLPPPPAEAPAMTDANAARAALLQRFSSLPYAGLGDFSFRSREPVPPAVPPAFGSSRPVEPQLSNGGPQVSSSLSRLDVLHEHQPVGEPPLTLSRRPTVLLARAAMVGSS